MVAVLLPGAGLGASGYYTPPVEGGSAPGWRKQGSSVGDNAGVYNPVPADGPEGSYPWYGYTTRDADAAPASGQQGGGNSATPWGPEYGYPGQGQGQGQEFGRTGYPPPNQGQVPMGGYRFRDSPDMREEKRDTRPVFRSDENKGRVPPSMERGEPYWQGGGMEPPPVFRPLDRDGPAKDGRSPQGVYPGYSPYPPGGPPEEFDGYPGGPYRTPW